MSIRGKAHAEAGDAVSSNWHRKAGGRLMYMTAWWWIMMEKLLSAINMAERTFGMIRFGITKPSESLNPLITCPA